MSSEEKQYLDIVNNIITSGVDKKDRTGTGTKSLVGTMMRFNLDNNTLPLLTTKKMNIKAIVAELLWFISGSTDATVLSKQGVNIWNANAKPNGDCGPIYGHQWRKFGAEHIPDTKIDTKHSNNDNTVVSDRKDSDSNLSLRSKLPVDQLQYIIDEIIKNPNSRRIIMSAWNPLQIHQMVLPPCHVSYQFICNGNNLTCMLYQRSGDFGLGIPFNIASAALLTHMIAKVTSKNAYELVHTICDSHVYIDHIQPLKEQLTRVPLKFPTLTFKKELYKSIDDFTLDDIIVNNYVHHPVITMKMSV
jgi:thymidylate synthase